MPPYFIGGLSLLLHVTRPWDVVVFSPNKRDGGVILAECPFQEIGQYKYLLRRQEAPSNRGAFKHRSASALLA